MRTRHLLLALLGVMTLAPLAGAATYTDGSFEDPDVTAAGGHQQYFGPGSYLTGSSGWQVVSLTNYNGGIRLYNNANAWVTPSDAHQLVALNYSSAIKGGIQQVFDTTPGQTYTLSFDYSSIGDSTARTNVQTSYEVDDAATSISGTASTVLTSGTATINTPAVNLTIAPWVHYTATFTASSTTSTVRFLSQSFTAGQSFGPVIDNVQITAVPEPASLGLMTLAAAPLLRRR